MKNFKSWAFIITVLFFNTAVGQDKQSKADKLLAKALPKNEHAVSVLVAQGDKILYQKAAGYADVENKVKADNETTFRIGSVTKQFYAAGILKLVEDGKMKLDDPLSKYIKDFPRGDEVTIHHLLTHTSGIKSYTDEADFINGVTEGIKTKKLINDIKALGYDFDPGEKWKYNNSAYYILGYLIGEVSGMSSEKYLETHFFEPVKMTHSGVYKNDETYENEALGYANQNGNISKALDWDMTWAGGAGNLYSTTGDLFNWNRQLFQGKVLTSASLEKAHTKVKLNDGSDYPYGYGWGIGDFKGLKSIAHSGGLHGFLSYLVYYPEIEGTVVVLSNCSPPKNIAPGEFSNKLADIFFSEHLEENEVAKVDAGSFGKFTGRYEYPGGSIMTITQKGDQLMAQLSGQAKFKIFPKSENTFFWKVVDAEITFHSNDDGTVDYATHKQGGLENKVPRVKEKKAVEMSAEEFKAFTGEYNLNGATVKVWEENNEFYTQITGQPKFAIYPKSENRFFMKEMVVEIEFDKSASPSGWLMIFQGGREIKASRK